MPLSHPIRAYLLVFTLDRQRYALRLDRVQRVVRAAAVTPLPKAPEVVLGILDLGGQVVPVINLRRRFRLPERELRSDDQFVVAKAGALTVALAVDAAGEVLEEGELELVPPESVVAGTAFLEGVAATREGLLLIHDLESLLFPSEERQLSQALAEGGG
ncbi:MAG TPA: chemotaxis protein CheW [Geomonas sp.]|nr:chemotaxis protein CheW [Geomonas sp.]